ncbi:MAG TPA: hypothetical protein DCL54_19645 [Alphaproteobacteria bacterium]|nr:hypothetical protein [Alphaproteobacteria bacterium]
MILTTKAQPDTSDTLNPEDPDFFDRCRDFATLVICPGGGRCQDPYFQASAIRMLASAFAFLALHGHDIPRPIGETKHRCACGGGTEASKRRRNRKPTSGGRIP